ncbi:MAG: aminotransferase class V-fold PLP-dependent enzyme [Clostridia bacterium]|nr:aminotransferase class V-fold PLP-dependent enzyme [Clostridia bacterium]
MTERPLLKAIKKYAGSDPVRFHMPGHKGLLSPLDVTEITGTDNLHSPHEAILRSEELCAEALGGRDAFFLVNGSTAGNLAMLFVIGCGKRILLGRNCHKSVINGIALAGHDTVPLFPDENGVFSAETVDRALGESPCDAVFITSPTYRGAVSPMDEIAEAAHRHGALLFADCAHGAHFAFSGELPPVPYHADAWCVSCHKTLYAPTQSAVLLTGISFPYPRERMQDALNMFQSTSPSYPLMLSIEGSVLDPDDWNSHVERIKPVRKEIAGINGVSLLGETGEYDLTRLNIAVRGMTGRELAEKLESKGIYPEMSDRECVTLITTPADPGDWYAKLIAVLCDASASSCDKSIQSPVIPALECLTGKAVMTVRDAITAGTCQVPLENAAGLVCAGAVGCYPPGIAVLFPGESITQAAVDHLLSESENGAELFGLTNGTVKTVENKA